MPIIKKIIDFNRRKVIFIAFFGFFVSTVLFLVSGLAADEANKPATPQVIAEILRPAQKMKTGVSVGLKASWQPIPASTEYQYMVTQESRYPGYDVVSTAVYRDWTSVGTVTNIGITDLNLGSVGPYIISVRAKSTYGVWSDAGSSNHVYLDAIGSEGGQVSSNDNKIKLIIPAGSLTQYQKITLQSVNPTNLSKASAFIKEKSLGAVECSPAGLVFNPEKPAVLSFILPEAQVPGTSIQLGSYVYTKSGTMINSSQTALVQADGYTVNFEVKSLFARAALTKAAASNTPIGSGVKIPLPDMFTGSFSHAVPITVPPGRKGMQPSLSLTYRSSNPNSWVGIGFSLSPGYIVRSTRLGPPTYDDVKDTFYFISDSGTSELVHLIDNLYQAKIESGFTKFFKESDGSWRILGKDGSILRFGQATESRESSGNKIFTWHITKAIDTNGNYIIYTYIKDQEKPYLSRIDYTGNESGVSPTNSVSFELESREDVSFSYISGWKITTAKRLKRIETKVKSDLVWNYDLAYECSPDTGRLRLVSVTKKTGDGKAFPVQAFTYQGVK